VYERRIATLAELLSTRIQAGLVLDVGSGDGSLAQLTSRVRPQTSWIGLEVTLRPKVAIPTVLYEGTSFPFADDTFSTVVCVDVLHHSHRPKALLRECMRVAREVVVVKDHLQSSLLDHALLRLLDWGGNMPHGIPLRYDYFTPDAWNNTLRELNANELHRQTSIPGMYPRLLQKLIGERIQFLSVIDVR
jgi:SAM-dependent methyltransferase